MQQALAYALAGYLSGSVLYSRLFAWLFHQAESEKAGADHNPGTANAFVYGGFACGMFTLLGDLFKAFFPVWLYLLHHPDVPSWMDAIVFAAPVIGHIYSVFAGFHGGKGIAASFGSTMGMAFSGWNPKPLICLIVLFLFFVLIVRIKPDVYKTAIVYLLFPISLYACQAPQASFLFSLLIGAAVLPRLYFSQEPKGDLEVSFLCRR